MGLMIIEVSDGEMLEISRSIYEQTVDEDFRQQADLTDDMTDALELESWKEVSAIEEEMWEDFKRGKL